MTTHSEAASDLFSPAVIDLIRSAIHGHGGNEIFLRGECDTPGGRVVKVEVLTFGNRDSTPALLDAGEPGDVVIHNHPSGVLLPSEADVQLASHYGNNNVGFYIVNNGVDQVLPVVRPTPPRVMVGVDVTEIGPYLGPGGALSRQLPGYEPRPQQVSMAELVARCLSEGRHALIEAGTGTGKSLGYLIPAVLWAKRNQGRVIVATHTINLQEQLWGKDTPTVCHLPGLDVEVALLKGRSNYVCLRKIVEHRNNPALIEDELEQDLRVVAEWSDSTADGTRSDLGRQLTSGVWDRVSVDPDDCTRVKCPHYDRCFYYSSRRQAASARIVIVNHHLLLADLFARAEMNDYRRSLILPPAQHLILDEGHHLEDVATSYSGGNLSVMGVLRILGRLFSVGRSERRAGALVALHQRLGEDQKRIREKVEHLLSQVEDLRRGVRDHLGDVGEQVRVQLQTLPGQRASSTLRIREETLKTPFWTDHVEPLLTGVLGSMLALVRGLHTVIELLEDSEKPELEGLTLELTSAHNKIKGQSSHLQTFMAGGENLVRWLELERPRPRGLQRLSARVCVSPIEVAEMLRERIFKPMRSVILTSATLTAAGSFDYLRSRLGIDGGEGEDGGEEAARVETLTIPSPFDMARQVYFGVPTDLGLPDGATTAHLLTHFVENALLISGGAAFVLFTSYAQLEATFRAVGSGGRVPFTLLRHGESARNQLLERFRQDTQSVLFGADSFWEGVDVQGEALRLVILTRLPFRVPSEPVFEARCEVLEAHGRDPFRELSLPQAVLRFKQGFGRLIRHQNDWGAVLVTDPRLLTKSYGRQFLASIQGVRSISGPASTVLEGMHYFFAKRGAGG